MLTLLVASLLVYKLDLPHWLYLVAIAVWVVDAGAWWLVRRSEDREFVFIHDKLTEIDDRIGELQAKALTAFRRPRRPGRVHQRRPGCKPDDKSKRTHRRSCRSSQSLASRGAKTLSSSEVGSPLQTPSLHVALGSLQSVSNTQAKAEVEARQTMQRIMITIRLRTLVPLLEPTQNHIAECPNLQAKARGN